MLFSLQITSIWHSYWHSSTGFYVLCFKGCFSVISSNFRKTESKILFLCFPILLPKRQYSFEWFGTDLQPAGEPAEVIINSIYNIQTARGALWIMAMGRIYCPENINFNLLTNQLHIYFSMPLSKQNLVLF